MKHRDFLLPATLAGLTLFTTPLATLLVFGASPMAMGQEPKEDIHLGKLPQQAALFQDVIVPVPGEIFGILDKLGSANCHDVLHSDDPAIPGDRPETALLLGSFIAEGFIAVEAHHRAAFIE